MQIDSNLSAVVTGGASGLGAATARALAGLGVKVTIFDMNRTKGKKLAEEIGALYCDVDIRKEDEIVAGFKAAREQNCQEQILINCAGIVVAAKTASRDKNNGAIKHFPLDAFVNSIDINLVGTFRCIAKSAAGMLELENSESGRGVIINTASIAAEDGQMGQAAYSASKGGIVGMTLPIARDLAPEGIRINTILPGIFDTPLMELAPENMRNSLQSAIPFPSRFGKAQEYASLVLEIIRNDYLNAACIRLDGAVRMAAK